MEIFRAELAALGFRGDIVTDARERAPYARDASIFAIEPALVICPRDSDDVCCAVRAAAAARRRGEDVSLTVRAGGTDMSGGPLTESVVVDMQRYCNVVCEVADTHVRAQAGAWFRDVHEATRERGFIVPSYPASWRLCTVGGMVANNSAGEKTLSFGQTQEYVAEVKAVLADGVEYTFAPLTFEELAQKKELDGCEGDVYRALSALTDEHADVLADAAPMVSKNSSGYLLWRVRDDEARVFDPTQIIVGSQGTLCIITEVVLRLVPLEPHSRMVIAFLPGMDGVDEIVARVNAHTPESFESYDDHTISIAMRYLPELVAQMKGSFFSLALQLIPDAWQIITGGIPKLVLIAEFTAASADEAEQKARAAADDLTAIGVRVRVTRSQQEGEKYWAIRRESFNLLRKHVRGKRTAPFIDDVIVDTDRLPAFLPRLYDILNEYDITYTIAGHIGDGNFHIIPLMDFSKEKTTRIIKELMERVVVLVQEFDGSLTAEHNDGLIRGPYLRRMYGDDVYALFEQVKEIFDPQHIFNPGKKTGASLSYSFAHIDTENAGG